MKRREVLSATAGALAVAGAGCTNDGTALGSLGDTPRPTPSDCDGHDRISVVDGVHYDEYGAFSLTTDAAEYAIGDEMTVRLVNESDERAETARKPWFDIQKRYRETWASIYWTTSFVQLPVGVSHPPGEGFRWQFSLTELDLPPGDGRRLCDPPTPGTYRFVYFGTTVEDDDRNGLASRFEVVESDGQ